MSRLGRRAGGHAMGSIPAGRCPRCCSRVQRGHGAALPAAACTRTPDPQHCHPILGPQQPEMGQSQGHFAVPEVCSPCPAVGRLYPAALRSLPWEAGAASCKQQLLSSAATALPPPLPRGDTCSTRAALGGRLRGDFEATRCPRSRAASFCGHIHAGTRPSRLRHVQRQRSGWKQ